MQKGDKCERSPLQYPINKKYWTVGDDRPHDHGISRLITVDGGANAVQKPLYHAS
jgi:hypothetical protein